MAVLGIDIGGTGMKGALVDPNSGELLTERFRVPTPEKRDPKNMSKAVKKIVQHFDYHGKVGVGFPTVIKENTCHSCGNLHENWKNVNVSELFKAETGLEFTVVNDADAAGFATMNFGVGKGEKGLVLMITIGTGIGSGAFFNGELLPNFELGQIPYKKYKKIEDWASNGALEREGLSIEEWAARFDKFLKITELLVAPQLFILGGGLSKRFAEYEHLMNTKTPIRVAALKNNAGIVGAAAAALK